MSFVTQTIVETTTEVISPASIIDTATTVTSHFSTTLQATHGQTVTISSPPAAAPGPQNTQSTPSPTTSTVTVTETEIDIYLQNAAGDVYSTWIIPLSPAQDAPSASWSPLVYVVEPTAGGWDDWSAGQRAGLIVGVVLAALLLFVMIVCCFGRRHIVWLAHRWPASSPHDIALSPPTPGPSFVQPIIINGPLVPYSGGQPGYRYGVGLRGGGHLTRDVSESTKRGTLVGDGKAGA